MSSNSENLHFLTITVVPQKEGLDVPALIRKISDLLSDKAPGLTVVHKLKVTGEARVFAYVKTSSPLALERVVSGLWKLGPVEVDCQPVVSYENFAENIKVADELLKKSQSCLEKEGLYWLEVLIEYNGKTYDEFMALWKKEATTVLTIRSKGEAKLELFKSLAQRKVHVLINAPEAAKLDLLALNLPIIVENGNNILINSRSVQFLGDYVDHLAELSI